VGGSGFLVGGWVVVDPFEETERDQPVDLLEWQYNLAAGIKEFDLLRSHVAMDEGALKFHRPASDRDLIANGGLLFLIQHFAEARRLLWRAPSGLAGLAQER
jgi:hypothetical protein